MKVLLRMPSKFKTRIKKLQRRFVDVSERIKLSKADKNVQNLQKTKQGNTKKAIPMRIGSVKASDWVQQKKT